MTAARPLALTLAAITLLAGCAATGSHRRPLSRLPSRTCAKPFVGCATTRK